MKKYLQSFAYIVFVFVSVYALVIAFNSYENPFDFYENPLVWLALIAFILVIFSREALNIVSSQKMEEQELREQGIDPDTVDKNQWFHDLMKKWTRTKAIEEEHEIILDHNYDGIKELDNSLPPWWLYLFYATMIFGVIYLVRYHVLDGDSQAVEFQKEMAAAKAELEQFKKASPTAIIDADNVEALTDDSALKRGKAVFNINCASCHAQDGGGGIGPNLTDNTWILGGGIKNVFTTISNGGRSGKGMIAWNKTLKPADIQKVASYILTLQGTSPANPKQAEGEVWEEE